MIKPSYQSVSLTFIVMLIIGSMMMSCSTAPARESTGQYIDSSVITTKVKAKLLNDKTVSSLPVTVKTYKNTVQLSGYVDNSYQKSRIVQLARSVEGVQAVQDFLVIKTY